MFNKKVKSLSVVLLAHFEKGDVEMSTKLIRGKVKIRVVPADCTSYNQAMEIDAPRVTLVLKSENPKAFLLFGYGGADDSYYSGNESDAIRVARHRIQKVLDRKLDTEIKKP